MVWKSNLNKHFIGLEDCINDALVSFIAQTIPCMPKMSCRAKDAKRSFTLPVWLALLVDELHIATNIPSMSNFYQR